MKKMFFFLLLFSATAYVFYIRLTAKQSHALPVPVIRKQESAQRKVVVPVKSEQMLFVPYWTLPSGVSKNYDSFVYFGITPGDKGIDTSDQGYLNIRRYITTTSPAKTLLAVTMTDKSANEKILDSPALWQQVISDSLTISHTYGFKGILLDFEAGGIGFDSVTKQVTTFITNFAKEAHNQQTYFAVAVYGDTFYRARPYDIQTIANNSDEIIVMAYDFHKPAGDPGPNFPLTESDIDEYSFQQMITDFTQKVPREKLTIAFGLFGYDWQVTEKGASINTASPISQADIQSSFIDSCKFSRCVLQRNASEEPSVSYYDQAGQKHIIWFEDMVSVNKKIDYLHTQGIGSVAFWANSYF